jgi:hypothetical protein
MAVAYGVPQTPTNPGRYPGAPSQQESIHVLDQGYLGPVLEWTVTIKLSSRKCVPGSTKLNSTQLNSTQRQNQYCGCAKLAVTFEQ